LAAETGKNWQTARLDIVCLYCGEAVTLDTAGDVRGVESHLKITLTKVDESKDAPEYADPFYIFVQLH
jgi:hypothetical protein